jgi:hypothetical protein
MHDARECLVCLERCPVAFGVRFEEYLPACKPATLTDFNLPQALDGLEVRGNWGAEQPTQSVRVLGESCASTSCEAAVAELDAQQAGWPHHHALLVSPSSEYVIGMNDGALVGSATADDELIQLIGPIDTVAEAELVAELKNLNCVRAGEHEGGFEIVSSELLSDCAPVTTQEVLYRIGADASLHELDRGDEEKQSNACIGPRPAGLSRRRQSRQSSRIGDFLARSAELEAASVIAFQVLEAELRAHGAPSALLERIRDAAADEVMHARLVQGLAERFGGQLSPRSVSASRSALLGHRGVGRAKARSRRA